MYLLLPPACLLVAQATPWDLCCPLAGCMAASSRQRPPSTVIEARNAQGVQGREGAGPCWCPASPMSPRGARSLHSSPSLSFACCARRAVMSAPILPPAVPCCCAAVLSSATQLQGKPEGTRSQPGSARQPSEQPKAQKLQNRTQPFLSST